MICLEIPETRRRIYLPADLAECDERQYADASLLLYRYGQNELDYFDFRVEMIYKMLNLKKGGGKLVAAQVEEMNSNIYMLSQFIDSFFQKDEEDKLVIKQYYTHNHTPVVKDSFRNWYGPADNFDDITFGQYIDALNLYAHLEKEKSKDLLYMFMATFYFHKWKEYDPRKVEKRAKVFRHVHFGRVYGFFLLFASFQKYLFSATVNYQGTELDLSILFASGEKETVKSDIPGIGMLSIAHQLAESGVYGPIKEVRQTNFWEVILRLYDIRKRDLDNLASRKKDEEKAKAAAK